MIGGKSIEAASLAVVAEYDDKASKGLHGLDKLVDQIAHSVTRKAAGIGDGFSAGIGRIGKAVGLAKPALAALGTAAIGVGLAGTAALAGLGAATVAYARRAVQAGSNLQETVNKNQVVFKQQSAAMLEWGQTAYKAMGLSAQGALEFAGTFGNLFTSMGLTTQASAKMSQGLVQLAADLASFNNLGVEEVLVRLQSGLVGEVEPMRRLGVNLSAAAVQAKALAMGLAQTKEALTPAMLVQARYAMILEQSKNAQGDFARTSTAWANQNRILSATLADITQKVGYELLPVFTPLLRKLTEFFQNTGPRVVDSVHNMIAALVAMQGVVDRVDLSALNNQAADLRLAFDPPTWQEIFGTIAREINQVEAGIALRAAQIDNILNRLRTSMAMLEGEISWQEAEEIGRRLNEQWKETWETYLKLAEEIDRTDYTTLIEEQERVNKLNAEATDYWSRHAEALRGTGKAAEPVKKDLAEIAKELEAAAKLEAPKTQDEWTDYFEQMAAGLQAAAAQEEQFTGAILQIDQERHAARLAGLSEYQKQALAMIDEEGAGRLERASKYGDEVEALHGTYQERALALLQENVAQLRTAETEGYRQRLETAANADAQMANAQETARGRLLDLLRGSMMEQAQAYAQHATTVVQLEQQRDQMLAYLEAQFQAERARLQASGDTQALAQLNTAHRAKYANTLNYYNQRIKAEQTGQANIFNTARMYYIRTLAMLRQQLVAQLRSTAATMAAMVKAVVGGYSAMTQAALAYKVAAAMGELSDIRAAIAEVEAMMTGLEGAGIAAAVGASVAFDEWQDSLGDLGGGLDDLNDKLDGLGDTDTGGGLSERIVDPIAEAARMAETLAGMIEKAIAAFDVLADWGGPQAGWQGKFTQLTGMISWVITSFAGAVDRIKESEILDRENREAIFGLADMAGAVIKVYKDMAGLVESVDVGPDIAAGIADLSGKIEGMVRAFATLYFRLRQRLGEKYDFEALGTFAKNLVEALKPWEAAAKAVEAVSGTTGARIGPAAERLAGMIEDLVGRVSRLTGRLDKNALRRTAEAAGRIVEALKPWEAAAKAVQAVLDASNVSGVEAKAERLSGAVAVLVDLIAGLAVSIAPDDLRRAAQAAGLVAEALKPWEAAAKAVQAVAGTTGARIGEAAERLRWQVWSLVRKVAFLARDIGPDMLQESTQAAGRIVEALKPWEVMVKTVVAIADATTRTDVGPKAERLREQTWSLVRKITWLARSIGPEILQESAQAADLIIAALKPWEVMAKTVGLVADSSMRYGVGEKAERLRGQVWSLVRKITWLAQAIGPDILQSSAQAAALVIEALKPWESMVKAVDMIAKSRMEVIGPKAERLIQQAGSLARKVARMGREVGLADLEFAARVGGLLTSALEPWDKAIRVLNDLRMWRDLPDFQEKIDRFARLWAAIIRNIIDAVRDIETEGLNAVSAFGAALNDLMGGLEAAAGLMGDFDFQEPDPTLWLGFTEWVRSVFVSYYDWINQRVSSEPGVPPVPLFDGDGLGAVTAFAAALRDLMGGLEAALGIARDFTFAPPDPAQWDAFTDWVRSVFVSYYDWINQRVSSEPGVPPVPLFDGDGLGAVTAFATALRDLMGGLEAALGVARDFTFTPPDPAQWSRFTDWVRSTFVSFYDWVNGRVPWEPGGTQVPDFDGDGLGMVTAFAGALSALMGGLQSALAIVTDFEFTQPDPAQWDAFFTWVTGIFETFRAEIARRYPVEDPDQFAPVGQWSAALGALMGGLQAAVDLVGDFEFTQPDPETWSAFFTWVTGVLEAFRAEIVRLYPSEVPDQLAPVIAWSNAVTSLMAALEAALDLAAGYEFTLPDPEIWSDFFTWTTTVLEEFRAEIAARYPTADAELFEPVVAWSNALESLMGALETATTVADGFAFIPPSQVGWDLFFTWVWDVFEAFQSRIEDEFPEDPEEAAAEFEPVIAFSNAMGAIFGGLQNALAFFMELDGPGAAFWQFLGGAGNPDTSPFAQRMGYIIGAITGTMAAFDAWVLQNAPTWTGNANTLLERVGDVVDVLQDALDLFQIEEGLVFPTTTEIEQFVQAVLQLFVSFTGGLANLTQGQGGLTGTVGTITSTVSGLPGTLAPIQTAWQTAGAGLTSALVTGMASQIGQPDAPNTLRWVVDQIQWRVSQFHGWWVPTIGEPAWETAGHDLVVAFIDGMESGLQSVYDAAYAIGATGNQGLIDGAAGGGGGGAGRPEGVTFAPMFAGSGATWTSTPMTSRSEVEVVIRFEGEAPAGLSRRQLDELKSTLVYEIKRRS